MLTERRSPDTHSCLNDSMPVLDIVSQILLSLPMFMNHVHKKPDKSAPAASDRERVHQKVPEDHPKDALTS